MIETFSLRFLLLVRAGWVNRQQLEVIDYLREENRILKEHTGGRRLRLTDDQRRRLAARPLSWRTFLAAHSGAIAAADFFTTEVWTVRGLVTYYTVFVIELESRRVHIAGSTPHPDASSRRTERRIAMRTPSGSSARSKRHAWTASCSSVRPVCDGRSPSSGPTTTASEITRASRTGSLSPNRRDHPAPLSGVARGSVDYSATITEQPDGSAEFSDSTLGSDPHR
jgi:hypothetical protein